MKVLDRIHRLLAEGKAHMTLIDPDRQSPETSGRLAAQASEAGTDVVMVGGSTGVTQEKTDATILAIKRGCSVPVILFPVGAGSLSPYADAVYFMSLLNSRTTRWIVGEQRRGVRAIRSWGLEAIPMAYLIVEPGMRAGEVGEADPIPRDRPEEAVAWALTGEFLGMRLVYLEAGSGAPEPVPEPMIRAVKDALRVPLVVGGGIRTADVARRVSQAGADIVVTGTVVEREGAGSTLKEIVQAVKAAT